MQYAPLYSSDNKTQMWATAMSPYKVLKLVLAKGNLGHYWSLEQHANDASHNFLLAFYTDAFSALTLSVGCQEEHPVCKNSDKVLVWLSDCSDMQTVCIWSSRRHCRPKTRSSFASFKSKTGVTFLVPAYPS